MKIILSFNQEIDIPIEIPSMPNEINTEPIMKNFVTINSVIVETKKMASEFQINYNNSPLMTEENYQRIQTVNSAKININNERSNRCSKPLNRSIKKLTNSYILPAHHLKEHKYLDVNFDDTVSRYLPSTIFFNFFFF